MKAVFEFQRTDSDGSLTTPQQLSHVDVAIFILDEERQLLQTIEQLRPITQIDRRIVVTPNARIASLLRADPTITVIEEKEREGKTAAVMKAIGFSRARDFLHISGDTRVSTEAIQLLIDTMATGKYGSVTAHANPTGDKNTIAGCVNALVWEVYNETNHYLNPKLRAKTGDVYIVRKSLVPQMSPYIINDDAFIDSHVIRQGLGCVEVEAQVFLRSPQTPWAHITQRSRIIQGHLQLFKRHGASPNTVEFSRDMSLPTRMSIVSKAVRKDRRFIKALYGVIVLEGLCWVLAFFDMLRGRSNVIWRRVASKS